jgi:hypothetical protein
MSRLARIFVVCVVMTGAVVWAEEVELNPSKDNTIYEASETLSNALGIGVFAGRTGLGDIVRGVMAFDLSGIPAGSTVEAVSLGLRQTNPNNNLSQPRTVSLHRLTKDWGEGTSEGTLGEGGGGAGGPATPGDATWLHTFFDAGFWGNPGGDFVTEASGSAEVAGNGDYVWESAGMVADVQSWVDNPESNFGWLLRGDESVLATAKRFGSRESGTPPVLLVQYTPAENGEEDLPHAVHFPQFGNGDGFFSQISLLNPDAENAVFARVTLRTDAGGPFSVVLNGTDIPDGIVELEIPPAGVRVLQTDASGLLETGSVTVDSDAPLGGVIVFGGAFGLAGVVASGEFSQGFAGPVESVGVNIRTGVAIQNLRDDGVAVELELLDPEGVVVATTEVALPAFGKLSLFVDEMEWDNAVDFSNFSGSVRTVTETGLGAIMIQNRLVNGGSQFATLPVVGP